MSEDKEYLALAAKAVGDRLPDQHGFILIIAPFGDHPDNAMRYASNVQRADAIKLLKEFLFKTGNGEDWMKHVR